MRSTTKKKATTPKQDKLATVEHWDDVHNNHAVTYSVASKFIGLQNFEMYRYFKKYIKPKYTNVFEVGCAPGNYLITMHKKFGLRPAGVEYSKPGFAITTKNLEANNVAGDIVFGDFFDKTFLTRHKNKYDVVYSLGFIEHFTNPQEAIDNHFKLVKKDGIVIITIPNLYYFNKYPIPKRVVDLHNLTIMTKPALKKLFAKHNIIDISYYGGLINLGSYFFDNKILEKIRFLLFGAQRVIIDPLFILLRKLGISLSNKYTSPQLIIIAKK